MRFREIAAGQRVMRKKTFVTETQHSCKHHLAGPCSLISEGVCEGRSCLCGLTGHHAMKAFWASGGIAPWILDLRTRWSLVVSFTPRSFYLQGKSPGTQWIAGWVGSRSGLNAVVKRTSQPLPGLESQITQPVAQCYSTQLSRLPRETSCLMKSGLTTSAEQQCVRNSV